MNCTLELPTRSRLTNEDFHDATVRATARARAKRSPVPQISERGREILRVLNELFDKSAMTLAAEAAE